MKITGPIPNHILKLMPQSERPKVAAGMTAEECATACDVKHERELQKQLNNLLLLHGAYVTFSRMDRKTSTKKGTPDFIFCYKGRYVAWEVKTPTGKCTLDQKREMDAILKAGGAVAVIHSVEQGLQSLKVLENK